MKILHIFDDYGTLGEKALPGEGSILTVIYFITEYAAEKGDKIRELLSFCDDAFEYIRKREE